MMTSMIHARADATSAAGEATARRVYALRLDNIAAGLTATEDRLAEEAKAAEWFSGTIKRLRAGHGDCESMMCGC